MVGACGPTGGSASSPVGHATAAAPNETPAASSTETETAEPDETPQDASRAPSGDGQTDTDWGPIWDSLPPGFPTYPGSTQSEEAATGPVSAIYVVPGKDAAAIAVWMQDALEQAAYSTESMSGPLEDGSFVIDSVGEDAECHTEVSIAPLGGTTMLTILYGTGCPHD